MSAILALDKLVEMIPRKVGIDVSSIIERDNDNVLHVYKRSTKFPSGSNSPALSHWEKKYLRNKKYLLDKLIAHIYYNDIYLY